MNRSVCNSEILNLYFVKESLHVKNPDGKGCLLLILLPHLDNKIRRSKNYMILNIKR
jgi:hypothetical protein